MGQNGTVFGDSDRVVRGGVSDRAHRRGRHLGHVVPRLRHVAARHGAKHPCDSHRGTDEMPQREMQIQLPWAHNVVNVSPQH